MKVVDRVVESLFIGNLAVNQGFTYKEAKLAFQIFKILKQAKELEKHLNDLNRIKKILDLIK